MNNPPPPSTGEPRLPRIDDRLPQWLPETLGLCVSARGSSTGMVMRLGDDGQRHAWLGAVGKPTDD